MPDVDKLIADWRRTVTAHFDGREDVLDELEGHLRDEIESLVGTGTPPEPAFLLATARLGHPGEIAAEFAKVPPPVSPWLPIRLALAAVTVLSVGIVWPLAPKLRAGGVDTLLAVHMSAVTLGYIATLLVGFLAACFLLTRLFRDPSAGQKESLKRAALLGYSLAVVGTGLGVGLGAWCPYEKHGWCFGLETYELSGIAIFVWDVLAACCCWLYRRTAKVHMLMVVGVFGNIVIALGWFGTSLGTTHHVSLMPNLSAVMVLVLSQFTVSCAAFAPSEWLRLRRS